MLAVVSAMMIGCGSSSTTTSSTGTTATKEAATTAPKDVVKDFLTTLQKADLDAAAKFTAGDNAELFKSEETKESQQVLKDLLGAMTFELGEEKVDGKKATVQAKVNAVDFTGLMQKMMSDMMTEAMTAAMADPTKTPDQAEMEKKAQEAMSKAVKDPSTPKKTTDVTVNLEKSGDSWKLTADNDKLITAAFGLNDTAAQ